MSFGAYLVGCLASLAGLACILVSGCVLRSRLLPGWDGPVAWVATGLLAVGAAIGPALVLGTFGLLTGWSWLLLSVVVAAALWRWRESLPAARARPGLVSVPASPGLTAVGTAIAAGALGAFVAGVSIRLGTSMTGFDSTWYHGPFAAGIALNGDTWSLHYLAPQFLSWFYPQNSEVIHSLGMMAFGTDLLSIFLNLGWFGGCLVAAWCIGRPYGAAPVSLAGVALVLGSTAMADQAGEARNDMVGTFFLLAALAVMVNAAAGGRRITLGPALVVTLAAGLAAGTKVNFIPAALVLLAGIVVLTEPSRRLRNGLAGCGALLLGGGYWYLRNLVNAGNPLPWINHIGPLSLPGPNQDVGGRDAGSVWGYLTDTDVIRHWFLPGFGDGFGSGWVLLGILAVAGLVLCLDRKSGPARRTGAAVGLALVLAWLVAPTSASGPAGEPNGFVSGLRYLAPALAVCLALLGSGVGQRGGQARWLVTGLLLILAPVTIAFGHEWDLKEWLLAFTAGFFSWLCCLVGLGVWRVRSKQHRIAGRSTRWALVGVAGAAVVFLILCGQGVQRYYFDHRYASPDFTIPALSEAYVWANGESGAKIGTNATRQYPLWGEDLDNDVQYIGIKKPHAGFVEAENCRDFIEATNSGGYDYLVLTLDREGQKLAQPRELTWISSDPAVEDVIRVDGGAVLRLNGPLSRASCAAN
ncbi:MAG: hypothetical protein J0H66_07850 [Solirubrobacterales bacterium]|nr:hypothetical protein [Solirubrobacterales bacterium]OJU93282.1 MAG: hypothetical protein BGO23_11385 [Solirubrobacterales bacterium 67-14]